MLCRVNQDRQVIVKTSHKTRSPRRGNGKLFQYSCHKNIMKSMKWQKDITPEDGPLRSVGVQYAIGEEWRAIMNSSSKNKASGSKQKRRSVVDVSGGESKVGCCKEQYFIGTWNVRSMNQGKLEVLKLGRWQE